MTEFETHENRVGIVMLAEQVKALVASHEEIKTFLREIDRRANEGGREMWARITALEREMAGISGLDVGRRIAALETDMASITGRIAGVSLAAGALAFLGSIFVRK